MSIDLRARITFAEPLSALIAHAERYVAAVPHRPFVVEAGDPAKITVGPFPVPEVPGMFDPARRCKEPFSAWERDDVVISTGPLAKAGLAVTYRAHIDELELGAYEPTAEDRIDSEATAGYGVDMRVYRNKASFALACLLVCAVGERHGTRIVDEANNLLRLGRLAEPAALAAIFAKHASATSFEAFADAFCRQVSFAPDWADAVSLVHTS